MNAVANEYLAGLRAVEADIAAGRLSQANTRLSTLLARAPADPRGYVTAALLAHASKNPAQEIAALQRAATVAPHWWPAFAELAKTLARNERLQEALAAAHKAVELAPQEIAPLEVAVAVANSVGSSDSARNFLEAALRLRPGDIAIRRALGTVLNKLQLPGEALEQWQAILAEHPEDVAALGWMGVCFTALGRRDEACAYLERALELDPQQENLQFHLTLARGGTPATQPLGSIQQLFDEYANRFDLHLQGTLKYDVPKRVADIIRARHPDLDVSILDLGCGTGLLGAALGAIKGAFVGVDLSRNMLEKAQRLDVYSRLRLNDLLAELRELPADAFDYVVANDVFIYVGDLNDVIPAAAYVLKPQGALIFSCETAQESEGALVLRKSKRYAHSRASIQTLCHSAGLHNCTIEALPELRLDTESGAIEGFLVVAQKK